MFTLLAAKLLKQQAVTLRVGTKPLPAAILPLAYGSLQSDRWSRLGEHLVHFVRHDDTIVDRTQPA
jgi:hypothetical protein